MTRVNTGGAPGKNHRRCRTLVEAQFETTKDMKEVQAHLDQNVLACYALVAPASILGLSSGPFSAGARPGPAPAPLPFGANVALGNRD